MSIAEFKNVDALSGDVTKLLAKFNGGSLMECHRKVYEATGIWIEELVPVFQKMDAMIVTRNLQPPA
jgi:hypothetical protein